MLLCVGLLTVQYREIVCCCYFGDMLVDNKLNNMIVITKLLF